MKKYLITAAIAFISCGAFSQTLQSDSLITTDSIKPVYQYRVQVAEVENNYSAIPIKDSMRDYFESEIVFNETLKQFIFISEKELTQAEIAKNFAINVNYFKKLSLVK